MILLFVGADARQTEKVTLAVRLRWPDAKVLVAGDEQDSQRLVELERPDIVVFQPHSAGQSTDSYIADLRSFSDVPLVVLEREGGGGEMSEAMALEAGADDYIRESSGLIDLVARLVALVRRARRAEPTSEGGILSSGVLLLFPASYEVFLRGSRLTLTSTEFRVLHVLLRNRGTVATHEFLGRAIWGDRGDNAALVKKYVQRLRSKLSDDPRNPKWIATIHGVGYRFVGEPAPQESPRQPVSQLAAG